MQSTDGLKKWKRHAVLRQLEAVITIAEAVEITGAAHETIKDAIKHERVIARQSGATWLIRKQDALDRWGSIEPVSAGDTPGDAL